MSNDVGSGERNEDALVGVQVQVEGDGDVGAGDEVEMSVFALASVFRFWLKLVFLTSSNNGPGETGREGEVDGDDELGVPSRLRKSGSC